HDERGGPAHGLREALEASGPGDPLAEGGVGIGWGLAHLVAARLARAGPRSTRPRHAARLQLGVATPQRVKTTPQAACVVDPTGGAGTELVPRQGEAWSMRPDSSSERS